MTRRLLASIAQTAGVATTVFLLAVAVAVPARAADLHGGQDGSVAAQKPERPPTPEERLVRVRRIFVESFGDDPLSKQAEAMVVDSLVKSKRFVVTENRERADAILKGTAVEKRSQELHAISESGAASTAVITANSDYSANVSRSGGSAHGNSNATGVARGGAVEDSQVTTETIDDARLSVRLVDLDGDVIWSTTQESRGAKYKGASADAADKVTKQLLREIAKIEKPVP